MLVLELEGDWDQELMGQCPGVVVVCWSPQLVGGWGQVWRVVWFFGPGVVGGGIHSNKARNDTFLSKDTIHFRNS